MNSKVLMSNRRLSTDLKKAGNIEAGIFAPGTTTSASFTPVSMTTKHIRVYWALGLK